MTNFATKFTKYAVSSKKKTSLRNSNVTNTQRSDAWFTKIVNNLFSCFVNSCFCILFIYYLCECVCLHFTMSKIILSIFQLLALNRKKFLVAVAYQGIFFFENSFFHSSVTYPLERRIILRFFAVGNKRQGFLLVVWREPLVIAGC